MDPSEWVPGQRVDPAGQDDPKVYDPFFPTKGIGEGIGQGLFQARNAIERHGGTIAFTSVEDVGTTFTLRLPIEPRTGKSTG